MTTPQNADRRPTQECDRSTYKRVKNACERFLSQPLIRLQLAIGIFVEVLYPAEVHGLATDLISGGASNALSWILGGYALSIVLSHLLHAGKLMTEAIVALGLAILRAQVRATEKCRGEKFPPYIL